MSELIITDANFTTEVLQSQVPVLVDFWAPWCAPCLQLSPLVAELANEYSDRLKVGTLNVDEHMQTAGRFGIMSLPTLLIFKNGQVVDQSLGVQPKDVLKQRIERVL